MRTLLALFSDDVSRLGKNDDMARDQEVTDVAYECSTEDGQKMVMDERRLAGVSFERLLCEFIRKRTPKIS